MQQHLALALLSLSAAVIAFTVFSNSLHGQFVIDDGSAVRTNQDLRPETPLRNLLINDFWGRPLAADHSVKSYRPLTVLSFRINFAAHGLDVFGYHLVNVLLHAACSALVPVASFAMFARGDLAAAGVAALAFAVHPVHTEAVASIVGRAELLCCVFYLLCLLSYSSAARSGRSGCDSATLLLAASLFAVLATASKETGITAPVVAASFDVLHNALRASAPPRARGLCIMRTTLAAVLVVALFAGSRALRGAQLSPYFSFVDNPLPSLPTRRARVLSALHVHVRYARLLLWPATLSADYSFDCVPAVTRLDDTRNVAAVALYLGFVWVALQALRAAWAAPSSEGSHMSTWTAAGRALLMLAVPMIPASHALVGIGTLIAERLLYIPSVGFCVLLGVGASTAMRATRAVVVDGTTAARESPATHGRLLELPRGAFILALLGAAALGAARTMIRNADWASSDAITNATARACPGSAKAVLSLGTMHLARNEHAPARTAFRAALRIHPTYCDALHWLGRLAFMEGRLEEAEPLLLAALEMNLAHPEANLFAALCAARRQDDRAALLLFSRAHEYAPHNAEIVRDYGAMLLRVGQPDEALVKLDRAVGMLTQLHTLGDRSSHGRGALASAQVKLAAVHLKLNRHVECLTAVRAAVYVQSSIEAAVGGLRDLCARGQREGLDTSKVALDMGL